MEENETRYPGRDCSYVASRGDPVIKEKGPLKIGKVGSISMVSFTDPEQLITNRIIMKHTVLLKSLPIKGH